MTNEATTHEATTETAAPVDADVRLAAGKVAASVMMSAGVCGLTMSAALMVMQHHPDFAWIAMYSFGAAYGIFIGYRAWA